MRRVVGAFIVVVVLGACGGADDNATDGAPSTTTTALPATERIGGVDAIVRGSSIAADGLEVELDDNYFKPNIILGTAGQKAMLDLVNEGKSVHNFSLGDKIAVDVRPGERTTVSVTLPATGDLAFFCKFHKDESGMVGTLRVSP
jgi:plastocyanin